MTGPASPRPPGILAGLWDPACPVVETGTRCLRESPVDRYSVLPLLGGLAVGLAGGGGLALGVLSVLVRAAEKSIVIEVEGAPRGACPVEPSTANALVDLGLASLGWWIGGRIRGSGR